jgi:hypothetical protein
MREGSKFGNHYKQEFEVENNLSHLMQPSVQIQQTIEMFMKAVNWRVSSVSRSTEAVHK